MSIPLDQFTKDGRPYSEPVFTGLQQKVIAFLDTLEDGVMFSTKELAEKIHISRDSLDHSDRTEPLHEYKFKESHSQVWWGNKTTIAEYPLRLAELKRRQSGDDNR